MIPRLIAHRGASIAAPENTLVAFELALGPEAADGVECDVRLTADDVPIVFHDAELDRVTGAPGRVQAMTVKDLSDRRVGGEPIPTLADFAALLAKAPRTIVNVELKPTPRPRELVAAARPHLDALLLRHDVIVSSFDPRTLLALAASPLRLGLIFEDLAALRALPLLGRPAEGPPLDLHPAAALVTAERVAEWKALLPRSELRAWTVDDAAEARRLAALGVAALITNRPGALRVELQAPETPA
ncbi:MAG: glycerophosphodiester phosphodiesterase [Deltaproteobacteria bacterium]|nr:glycerophosphodiester phosphodiesterase [Deltaproteobacteria bacterium]